MKLFISIVGLINGLYMFADGVYVLMYGKYIGPPKPGPWSVLFEKLHVDVFKLGPVFVVYGLLWLTWLYGLWSHASWSYTFGMCVSIATLWYLPLGTLFSLLTLAMLVFGRQRLGV